MTARPRGRRVELELETPEQRRSLVLTIVTRDGWQLEAEVVRAAGELGIPADEVERHIETLTLTGQVERRKRVDRETGQAFHGLFPTRKPVPEPTSWTLVEPCCGSAALTLHLLGAKQALAPYQGTKWGLRRELSAAAVRLGFFGQPSHVVLGDVGPWAEAIAAVLTRRSALLDALRPLVAEGERDPSGLYYRLAHSVVPSDPTERAATLLWLQRMNYASKAVGIFDAHWVVHGINTTSAYGVAGTDKFGEVKPQGPALLRAVEHAPTTPYVTGHTGELAVNVTGPTLCYLDPPYAGTTAYPSGHLDRNGAVGLARRWAAAGAAVVVSEASPVAELVEDGWESTQLRGSTQTERRQRFRRGSSAEEWITVRRAVQR